MMIDMIGEVNKELQNDKIVCKNAFTPWKRILHQLETGEIDIFFGIAKNPYREKKYIFIDPPIINVFTVFAIRSDDKINPKNLDDILALEGNKTILVQYGSGNASWVKKKSALLGLEVDDGGRTTEINLKKLMYNRGRIYIHNDLAIRSTVIKNGLQDQIKVLPVKLREFGHYIAFSPAVHKEAIDEIKQVVETLNTEGVLKDIYDRYTDY